MSSMEKILKEDQVYQHLKIRLEGLQSLVGKLQEQVDQVEDMRHARYTVLNDQYVREWRKKNPLGGDPE